MILDHETHLVTMIVRHPLITAPALVALGLPGIASLLLALPNLPGVPRLALLINPAVLLVIFAFAGAWASPRVGLRSTVGNYLSFGKGPLLPRFAAMAALLGGVLGLVAAVADQTARPLWQVAPQFPPSLIEGWQPGALVAGLLYGGVVEEIMMRWGLMSLLLLGLWRLVFRRSLTPPPTAVWIAIVLSALLFAAGHLPALAALGVPFETPVILRTLAWNVIGGCLFGWIFARHDLESAMASHAGFHVGVFAAVGLHSLLP